MDAKLDGPAGLGLGFGFGLGFGLGFETSRFGWLVFNSTRETN